MADSFQVDCGISQAEITASKFRPWNSLQNHTVSTLQPFDSITQSKTFVFIQSKILTRTCLKLARRQHCTVFKSLTAHEWALRATWPAGPLPLSAKPRVELIFSESSYPLEWIGQDNAELLSGAWTQTDPLYRAASRTATVSVHVSSKRHKLLCRRAGTGRSNRCC